MTIISNYESKVDELVKKWNARIEGLSKESRHANASGKKKYDEEISRLIGSREALRRGLFRLAGSGEEICLTCPGQSESEAHGNTGEI
jgi:hypothetical protein